ncbi:MAG: AraC family transcriptional regulator [Synergistaceae bacterium]|nr:AraC family transcriptional regulator [Synergistaceae bacterium]
MNGWMDGIQNAIRYIEDNITEDLNIEDIAACSYVSAFYFQRIFSVLCGVTVGEYIRNRRLTLAAQELSRENDKVINIAMKYGYESPDSFARAFARFHGVSPSAAAKKGARLRAYAPLHIKISMEGGTMLEYKIAEKEAFTVMGKSKKFNTDTSYDEIPSFWREHMKSGENQIVCGMYGICIDVDGKIFDYLIADNYIPWNEIPNGYVTKVIPAGTWAIFPCHGALSKSLQDVNTKIWSEWLPNCREYRLGGNYSIELYAPLAENPEDTYCEIWVPIEKL